MSVAYQPPTLLFIARPILLSQKHDLYTCNYANPRLYTVFRVIYNHVIAFFVFTFKNISEQVAKYVKYSGKAPFVSYHVSKTTCV